MDEKGVILMKIIKELEKNNEDYEFYPTTQKMIDVIKLNSNDNCNWLDIGAGDGNFAKKIGIEKIRDYFVIEKSKILRDKLPDNSIILGCDFYETSLIDKRVDYIFCNPPYSEFEKWIEKILEGGNFEEAIFLIIPSRWINNKTLLAIFEARKLKYEIILEDDFLHAERQARAKIHVLKITHISYENIVDPFDFILKKMQFTDKKESLWQKEKNKKEDLKNQIIHSDNLVEVLMENYNDDLKKIHENYIKLGELSSILFEELGVNLEKIKESLRNKLSGLKNIYWQLIFDKFQPISDKLIKEIRDDFRDKLISKNNIDFNTLNIYMILDWVVKNVSGLFDEQLKKVFLELASVENIKNYKSNKKVYEYDRWKYKIDGQEIYEKEFKKEFRNFKLDYRIIIDNYRALDKLKDLLVIAKNLGFDYQYEYFLNLSKDSFFQFEGYSRNNYFNSGQEVFIYLKNGDVLLSFRAFKNRNIHIKCNQQFMKAFNIEFSRIMGWIHSREEAAAELEVSLEEFDKYYNCNTKIDSSVKLLEIR